MVIPQELRSHGLLCSLGMTEARVFNTDRINLKCLLSECINWYILKKRKKEQNELLLDYTAGNRRAAERKKNHMTGKSRALTGKRLTPVGKRLDGEKY